MRVKCRDKPSTRKETILKKLFIAGVVSVLALAARGAVFSPTGPAVFNLKAATQGEDFQITGGKTNETANSTNIITVFKSTIVTTAFANSNFLALLANSFNTNFPAGAQIGMRGPFFLVVDSTGTNIIFNPSEVVSVSFGQSLASGTETEVQTTSTNGFSLSGNSTVTETSSVTITYNDTAQTTGDSTHSNFEFQGLIVVKTSEDIKTRIEHATTTLDVTGGGSVRGVGTIFTGTITVKAAGAFPPT